MAVDIKRIFSVFDVENLELRLKPMKLKFKKQADQTKLMQQTQAGIGKPLVVEALGRITSRTDGGSGPQAALGKDSE